MPADRRSVVRLVLIAGALLMIAVGVAVFFAVDALLGGILALVGVIDLLTIPLVLRAIEASRAAAAPPGEDPDYNPYARED